MRKRLSALALAIAISVHALPAQAIQCVPYAREVSGLDLKGDAWKWWTAAAGRYDRGRKPQSDSVLVFARQGKMRYGHVAVVTAIVHSRMLLVDHANWAPARTSGRGKITHSVAVLDVSAKNDWSRVRVWYEPAGDFGDKVYRTDGFIYNPTRHSAKAKVSLQAVALQRAAAILPGDFSAAWLHDKSEIRSDGPVGTAVAETAPVVATAESAMVQNLLADAPKPIAPAQGQALAQASAVGDAIRRPGLDNAIAAAKTSFRTGGSFLFN